MTEGNVDNPFRGKYVEFIAKCSPEDSEILQDVELRTLAGREFLVGKDVHQGFYRIGLEVWIALDDVAQFALFDDLEEMNSKMTAYRQRLKADTKD